MFSRKDHLRAQYRSLYLPMEKLPPFYQRLLLSFQLRSVSYAFGLAWSRWRGTVLGVGVAIFLQPLLLPRRGDDRWLQIGPHGVQSPFGRHLRFLMMILALFNLSKILQNIHCYRIFITKDVTLLLQKPPLNVCGAFMILKLNINFQSSLHGRALLQEYCSIH